MPRKTRWSFADGADAHAGATLRKALML